MRNSKKSQKKVDLASLNALEKKQFLQYLKLKLKFQDLDDELSDKKIPLDEIIEQLSDLQIPSSIFNEELSVLESLTKYLKENLKFKNKFSSIMAF